MKLLRRSVAVLALALTTSPLHSILAAQGPIAENGSARAHNAAEHALPSPRVLALRRAEPIHLDGKLDEPRWTAAPAATNFRQAQPKPGDAATQRTEVRILFDDEALYVGARMFDSAGRAGIRSQLVRRDQGASSDWIELIFDTYHNHIGRTVFAVNPSGVKQDAGQATEFADESWDPVYEVKTSIDSAGWTAEFRIPFSQLRFSRDSVQSWGMQVWRTTNRSNEVAMWSYWAPEESGGPSRFGHIDGLAPGRGAGRRLEVLPYIVGQFNSLQPGPAGDPFFDRHEGKVRLGGDMKYLLTSNVTLDATFNPDFGQVEVDPAVVNLSAFETFFPERRPFFVEGSGVFGFGGFSCYFCSNASSLSLFYSRRIGRTPQGLLPEGTSYSKVPDATTILGAAKVTGRTRNGFTIGLLDAVTDREDAPIVLNGNRMEQRVEPYTNYFVGRLKKDFKGGNIVIGAIGTSVIRSLRDPLLESRLAKHSEAVGIDYSARWKNRTYSLVGNVAFSNVSADPAVIRRLQNSSARYFQRPDREPGSNRFLSDRYDPNATALRGLGGYTRLAKEAGKFRFESAVNWRTPGFEANDLAFNTRSDYFWMNANVALSLSRPTNWYRNYFLVLGNQRQYNFDGDRTDTQFHVGAFGQLRNYWGVNLFAIRRTDTDDDGLLRGGPVVQRPGYWYFDANINSDDRKRVRLNLNSNSSIGDLGNLSWYTSAGIDIRPASNVTLSFNPSYRWSTSRTQYVSAIADPTHTAFYGTRYVLSDLEQTTLGLDTRINTTFTPTLTLELYLQPFLSAVHYKNFKEYAAPRSGVLQTYGKEIGTIAEVRNQQGQVTEYTIDPDAQGPAAAFTQANPDFNLRSLRGNAVLRWEYRPGSTLYL
ncbi:MAG: carbohydrate binding family 9 domain-containing protein, partial [Gemmatimonadales bacterium]|nr:carbohydrate binding family 9 domain-containing protein [Gemmatimonadales bacterium]